MSDGHRLGDDPEKLYPGIRLGGFAIEIWIPTLKGFPIGKIEVVPTDPLANKDALANKVLSVLVASGRTFTVQTVVEALQAEGLAKEPKAVKRAVSQALQTLKRRKLAVSGGRRWLASVHTCSKGGKM